MTVSQDSMISCKKKILSFLSLPAFLFISVIVLFLPVSGIAGEAKSSYEVKAKSPANNGDFVRARENAVAQAMRMAVDQYLRDVLGEDEYARHERSMRNIVQDAGRYVRSYRFISADDNAQAESSEVELEVGLFADALRKRLGVMGIIAVQAPAGARAVVVLINEKSLSSGSVGFWDTKPVSESILAKIFSSAGINVIGRDSVRESISEDMVLRAAKGDVGAAIEIGQKAGADVVVVGNAMSTLLEEGAAPKPVQVGMSIKAISSFKARVVAAKSDFTTVKKSKQNEAEAEAQDIVGKKLGEFFLASIQRFWSPSSLPPSDSPPPSAPTTSPRPLEDL